MPRCNARGTPVGGTCPGTPSAHQTGPAARPTLARVGPPPRLLHARAGQCACRADAPPRSTTTAQMPCAGWLDQLPAAVQMQLQLLAAATLSRTLGARSSTWVLSLLCALMGWWSQRLGKASTAPIAGAAKFHVQSRGHGMKRSGRVRACSAHQLQATTDAQWMVAQRFGTVGTSGMAGTATTHLRFGMAGTAVILCDDLDPIEIKWARCTCPQQ